MELSPMKPIEATMHVEVDPSKFHFSRSRNVMTDAKSANATGEVMESTMGPWNGSQLLVEFNRGEGFVASLSADDTEVSVRADTFEHAVAMATRKFTLAMGLSCPTNPK